MKEFVLDTSVVLKWFSEFGENDLDRSLQLRTTLLNGSVFLVVPELLFYELANALRYNPRFSPKDVEGAVSSVLDMGLDVRAVEQETLREAINLAYRYNGTVYDTYFLALSIREGKPLITADYKFTEKLKGVKGIIKLSET
jgi:predicted nucleic acid-binding protein